MKNSVEADFYKVSCSINNRLSRISDKASLTGKVFMGQTKNVLVEIMNTIIKRWADLAGWRFLFTCATI